AAVAVVGARAVAPAAAFGLAAAGALAGRSAGAAVALADLGHRGAGLGGGAGIAVGHVVAAANGLVLLGAKLGRVGALAQHVRAARVVEAVVARVVALQTLNAAALL